MLFPTRMSEWLQHSWNCSFWKIGVTCPGSKITIAFELYFRNSRRCFLIESGVPAEKIANAVQPQKIILFGSYAYGKPTYDSDVDFLLVVGQKFYRDRDKIYLKASKQYTICKL